jgi:hypothetical protein
MDNCSNTLQQCLKLLQLKYTPDYIADALNKHNSRTFTINNMLHPNQLKTVLGGYGYLTGCKACKNNSDCPGDGVCAKNYPPCPNKPKGACM